MNNDIETLNKASTSNESISSKVTKSDEQSNRGKERRKQLKKKMLRSSTKRNRLSGGADPEQAAAPPADAEVDAGGDDNEIINETGTPAESARDSASCAMTVMPRQPLPTTGDPRVDEMLDCALQNLEEAGKALASLGENLEHELKLFLIELMGRTRKWTSHVESKIEWTRRDILELHKELSSRIAALEECRRESAELKAELEEAKLAVSEKPETKLRAAPSKQNISKAASQACSVGQSASVCTMSRIRDDDGEPLDAATIAAEAERLQMCCAELESEVIELRKENERIVKERAEYENAIQRALLKGVSSLNVEALKVLRCTPIPSCCPPPCPPSTTVEQMPRSSRDCGSARSPPPQMMSCGNGGGNYNNGKHRNSMSRGCNGGASKEALGSKRVCPSASERKSRKSKDNNMLLLLHQKDAECFGIQASSNNCDPPQKKSNTCGGGNCGKYGRC